MEDVQALQAPGHGGSHAIERGKRTRRDAQRVSSGRRDAADLAFEDRIGERDGLTAPTSQRSSAAGTRARKAAGPPASMIRSWPPARNLSAVSVTGKPSRSRGARASTAASECDPA